jgi:hypothetical protein
MWISKQLKLQQKFDFEFPVWRLILSDGDLLLVEERDSDKREAFFHVFELSTGRTLLNKFSPPDKFWSGVESLKNKRVIFHGYRSQGLPFHKGIFCFDLEKGDYLWQEPELSFLMQNEQGIFAFKQKFESQLYFLLDRETGQIVGELGEDDKSINLMIMEARAKESFDDFVYPENFTLSKFNDGGFLEKLMPQGTLKEVTEVFAKDGIIFLNTHRGTRETGFINELLAIDSENQKVIKKMMLNQRTENLIAESCFIYKGFLFLIINKKSIEIREIKK